MNLARNLAILVLATLVAACAAPTGTTIEDGVSERDRRDRSATARGLEEGEPGWGTEFGDPDEESFGPSGGVLDTRVIYFDFDRYDVKSEYTEMLQAHGRYLAGNPGIRLRLEGHTDERGTREYNIGLGERRAQAVRRFLLLQGVDSSQLVTVSFGEERPAVLGSDEETYSLNRRVELVYTR